MTFNFCEHLHFILSARRDGAESLISSFNIFCFQENEVEMSLESILAARNYSSNYHRKERIFFPSKGSNFVSKLLRSSISIRHLLLNQCIEQSQFGFLLLVQQVRVFDGVAIGFQHLPTVDVFEVVLELLNCPSQLFLLFANGIEVRVQLFDGHRVQFEIFLKGDRRDARIGVDRG